MKNNQIADNYYLKAKEIYYRNFFILTNRLSVDNINEKNNNNELTLNELISGLHTSINLFLISFICR